MKTHLVNWAKKYMQNIESVDPKTTVAALFNSYESRYFCLKSSKPKCQKFQNSIIWMNNTCLNI